MCPKQAFFVSGGEDEMRCKINYNISKNGCFGADFFGNMVKTGKCT
jgi:hypothetical protein